jgi:hypothetical protein
MIGDYSKLAPPGSDNFDPSQLPTMGRSLSES